MLNWRGLVGFGVKAIATTAFVLGVGLAGGRAEQQAPQTTAKPPGSFSERVKNARVKAAHSGTARHKQRAKVRAALKLKKGLECWWACGTEDLDGL